MSVEFNRWVQTRLNLHGLTTDVDGLASARFRTTLGTFQRSRGIQVTETATAATVTALRQNPRTGRDEGPIAVQVRPVWLAEMERRLGLHEVKHRSALMAWLRSDGRTLGDPAKLPWCGDAVQTAIALTLPNEPQLANPYLARNWLTFGKSTQPRLGAVLVFWRGTKGGTSGHVGIYVGEDDSTYHVIGGNQANALTVTRIAKSRFLGARWPLTDSNTTQIVQRAATDPISTNEA